MSDHQIITLLTDFGLMDGYVGVMKGVIAQINPALTVVDLTHQIPPQQIAAARFTLMNAYPYFPDHTVHIVVVDPGVGSQRRGIALQLDRGFLVGPDNGVLSGVFSQNSVIAAVELTNRGYWRTPTPSTTFHGRDIFATVGAYLTQGIPIEELGEPIDPNTLVRLQMPEPSKTERGITGCIQYIDHFGNIITTIPGTDLTGKTWSVVIGDRIIPGNHTYSDVAMGEAVALIGSQGWVEIAVNSGNAQSQLGLEIGKHLEVILITQTKG